MLDVKVKSRTDPRRLQARGDDPQLRRHPSRAFRTRWLRPGGADTPRLEDWPEITRESGGNVRRVNVDGITKAELASWKSGDTVLLSGKILTGRDAAHKRIADMLKR